MRILFCGGVEVAELAVWVSTGGLSCDGPGRDASRSVCMTSRPPSRRRQPPPPTFLTG